MSVVARRTLEQRYFTQFFVSILVAIGNGAIFCFGIFSPFMNSGAFHMSQTEINIVSTCGAVLSYFSLPTGYLYDRHGPYITLLVGALLNIIGWLGMFVIFYDMENPLLGTSFVTVAFFFGISQWSASFFETGSVLTNLEAFSLHRGNVVIIQKTFMGLGSSIIAQWYYAFFDGVYPISAFFAFLMTFNSIVGVVGAYIVRLPTVATRVVGLNATLADVDGGDASTVVSDERGLRFGWAFRFGIGLLLLLVAFVAALTIVEGYTEFDSTTRLVIGTALIVLVVAFGGMVFCLRDDAKYTQLLGDHQSIEAPSMEAEMEGNNFNTKDVVDRPLNAFSLFQNIATVEMWLLWFVSFGVWGCGTVVSANSTQIYRALDFYGYKSSTDSVFVSIYGVASALGRIGVGFGERWLRSRNRHVVRMFVIAPILNIIGIPLFLLLPPESLLLPFLLTGLATGVTWGSTVLIIKALFAPQNCGKHYNVLYTAGMLTPIVLNVGLFGPLYDEQSRQQGLEATHTCNGVKCVSTTLVTCLALNVLALPCAVLFVKRVLRGGLSG